MPHIELSLLLEALAAFITSIGGIYSIIHHISGRMKRNKEKYRQEILAHARAEMDKIEVSLSAKIKDLEEEFESQKLSVNKDFSHFKETYNMEVKSLGEKIEALRDDLAQQHQALVGLLTKLVDTK